MHAKSGIYLYFLFKIPSYIIVTVILFTTSKFSVYILRMLIQKIASEHRRLMIFLTTSPVCK